MISKIRWKKGDFITLGKAAKNFNKKIDRIITEENKLYIPEKVKYTELKQIIKTRAEFNNLVKSLKRFQRENAEDLFTFPSGQKITKWQKNEIDIQMRIITREYNKTMEQTSKTGYLNVKQRKYQRQMESLKNIKNVTGDKFKNKLKIIDKLSNASYDYKKAENYQKMLLTELETLSSIDEDFKILYDRLSKNKNPNIFYKEIEKSEILKDFFLWYDGPESYGKFNTTKDLVDKILDEIDE